MKHSDPIGFAATDWTALVALMPPDVKQGFDKARKARVAQRKCLLDSEKEGTGGLTTYVPGIGAFISAYGLEMIGELMERCDLEARSIRDGLVSAHEQVTQ